MPSSRRLPGSTLIWGDNGSGKTSLLEAMFLLGRGRSFRTRNNERLVQRGNDHLRVIGRIQTTSGEIQTLGFEATSISTTARIAGRPAQSLAELSNAFPVQVIEPGVHRLVEEGGYRRRRWMDWAVFHVEPSIHRHLAALHARAEAAQCSAQDRGLPGPGIRSGAGASGRADSPVPAAVRDSTATVLAGCGRRSEWARSRSALPARLGPGPDVAPGAGGLEGTGRGATHDSRRPPPG